MILFLSIIFISVWILLYLYYYKTQIDSAKKSLGNPKYFFMEPRLFFLFMEIYDMRYYNKKTFFECVKHADQFCNVLFLLNLDKSWKGLAGRYSTASKEERVQIFQIKSLLQKLKETRLNTLNTLESMFITVLPKDLLTTKLKNTIFKINQVMLFSTEKECQDKGLLFTEFTQVPYEPDSEHYKFFVN